MVGSHWVYGGIRERECVCRDLVFSLVAKKLKAESGERADLGDDVGEAGAEGHLAEEDVTVVVVIVVVVKLGGGNDWRCVCVLVV